MPRITPVQPADASGKTKQMFDAVQAKLGLTPNLVKTLATSPAALEGYLGLNGALAGGTLNAQFMVAVHEGEVARGIPGGDRN